jgi:hypothetical protein
MVQVFTLRIELAHTEPKIWREVELHATSMLNDLHDVIQAAMGSSDQHLWEVRMGRQIYAPPFDDDDFSPVGHGVGNALQTRLGDLLTSRRTRMQYIYDMGDNWLHELTFTSPRPAEADMAYPRYVGGDRNAPPEDCGGVVGFYEVLAIQAVPEDPDHAEVVEWLGDYDADLLDEEARRAAVARLALLHRR